MVSGSGETVFTTADITAGQVLFNRRGLMQYGSIVGHGAYLGPDYTADYLRRSADFVEEQLRRQGSADPRADLIEEFRTNRYDKATGVLTLTDNQVLAFEVLKTHYAAFFGEDSTKNGLIPRLITDPQEIHQLTTFGQVPWGGVPVDPSISCSEGWFVSSLSGIGVVDRPIDVAGSGHATASNSSCSPAVGSAGVAAVVVRARVRTSMPR